MAFTVETPSILPADRSGPRSVILAGSGTAWTNATTFTLSGVPVTPLESIVSGPGMAELVVSTAGSGTGTLTIHDGSGATATVAVRILPEARRKWFPGLFPRNR